jgi:hypothetical protein
MGIRKKIRRHLAKKNHNSDSRAGIESNIRESMILDIQSDADFMNIYEICQKATMISIERAKSLYDACEYLAQNKIPGDWVECGVWKGGAAMIMAHKITKGGLPRNLYLYDTFEGMSSPTDNDVDLHGTEAKQALQEQDKDLAESVWCFAPLDEVKRNIASTGLEYDSVVYCQGKVEETIPDTMPEHISLLRLDTDWYESTKHELVHLYPRLVSGGALIIDDYGFWKGCRKAVDEFIQTLEFKPLMHRIDVTGAF